MTEHLSGFKPKLDDEKSHPSIQIQRKRSFTLHEKRISKEEFKKKTAAMLRENPDLFNMNEIGTVADEESHVTLNNFQGFLNDLLKPELTKQIFECIDVIDGMDGIVSLTAITRFLTGRSRVAEREQTIIDEAWLVDTLRNVNLGDLDEDGNNMIELEEFRHFFLNLEKDVPQELVDKVFNDIDKDKDGHITTFEYFKWREGFKAGALHQYLPAKIKKSTTHLKLLGQGTKINRNRSNININNNDNRDNNDDNDNDEIEKLKLEIEKLKEENLSKDKEIKQVITERDELQNTIEQLTPLFEQMTVKASEKDEQCEILKNEIKDQKQRIKMLEQELEEEEVGNQALNERIAELEKQLKNSSNEELNGLNEKIIKLEKLLATSQETADENDKLQKDINELTKLFQELQNKIKERDESIKKYKQQLDELQLEYKEEVQGNESLKESFTELQTKYELLKQGKMMDHDIVKLREELNEKNILINKIKHENGEEIKMIQKDKDNLWEQLEETYQVINDELIIDKKINKKNKRNKIKQIDTPDEFRKELKRLKTKIDIKNDTIKELQLENENNKHKSLPSPSLVDIGLDDNHTNDYNRNNNNDVDDESDIDIESVLSANSEGNNSQNVAFKHLFSWLKDF